MRYIRFSTGMIIAAVSLASFNAAAALIVSEPQPDSIVAAQTIRVAGSSTGATVTVTTGTFSKTIAASGGWEVLQVPLSPGLNAIRISAGSSLVVVAITRVDPLPARHQQRVRLDWKAGVEADLWSIASNTISPQPNPADKTAFVSAVETGVQNVLANTLSHAGNMILTSDTDSDVHMVEIHGIEDSVYARTTYDCENAVAGQVTYVFAGTFRRNIVKNPKRWKPIMPTDGLAMRIEDLAQILARTIAHEIGHGMGLVAESGNCKWMSGCDAGHSCRKFHEKNVDVGVDRFAFGRFIMDPGESSKNHYRLGYPDETRNHPRLPSVFCNFDRSYLTAIQPF